MTPKTEKGTLTLREAVLDILRLRGIDSLSDPRRFRAMLLDLVEPGLPTTNVIVHNCTESLLEPYRQAAITGTSQALDDAMAKATLWLKTNRQIASGPAEQAARELAYALSTYLGIAPSPRLRAAVKEEVPGQTEQSRPPKTALFVPQAPNPKPVPATPTAFVGAARLSGEVDGVFYELDISDTHVGCSAVLRLCNSRDDTVDVLACVANKGGGKPRKTCKSIASGVNAVITFGKRASGLEWLTVEASRGFSPNRRFACLVAREGTGHRQEVNLKVTNVSKARARVETVVVLEGIERSVAVNQRVGQGIEPGEVASLSFATSGAPKNYEVYVNGVSVPTANVTLGARGQGAAQPSSQPTSGTKRVPAASGVRSTSHQPASHKEGMFSRPDYASIIAGLTLSGDVKERKAQLAKAGVPMTLYNLVIWVDCWFNALSKFYVASLSVPVLQDAAFRTMVPRLWSTEVCFVVLMLALGAGWVYVRFCLAGFKRGAPKKYFAMIALTTVLATGFAYVAQSQLVQMGYLAAVDLTSYGLSAAWNAVVAAVMWPYFKKRAALFDR